MDTGPQREKFPGCTKVDTGPLNLIGPPNIGVARIFDLGGPNHKSHAMTSTEIFKKGPFCTAKIS